MMYDNICILHSDFKKYADIYNSLSNDMEKYIYRVNEFNSYLEPVTKLRGALIDNERDDMHSILTAIAIQKIIQNFSDYIQLVLKNSYYSWKMTGDDYRFDLLGPQYTEEIISMTNSNIPMAVEKSEINFNPVIYRAPADHFFKDFLLQPLRLLLNGKVVTEYLPIIILVLIGICVLPFIFRFSVVGLIMYSCSMITVLGTVIQNLFYPAIGRLLALFHPLMALGVIVFVIILWDKVVTIMQSAFTYIKIKNCERVNTRLL